MLSLCLLSLLAPSESLAQPFKEPTGTLTLPIKLKGLEAFGITVPDGTQLKLTLGPGNPITVYRYFPSEVGIW